MSVNLRLSPSGPQIGEVALMPFRVVEDRVVPEVLVLTGVAQAVDADLIASLAGPFAAGHYLSVEAQLDCSNSSTNILGSVTITVQVRVDGGAWADVYTEAHSIGAHAAVGSVGDDERQIRPILIHTKPIALASWGAPPADAALLEVRLMATASAGETDTIQIEADEAWIRFTDHSNPADQVLRQPPSGPVVGGIDIAPLRIAENSQTLGAPLVLTGAAQDVNSALRASLIGPFDPSHYFSAECNFDISNDSTNVLASVTITIEVSQDGGAFAAVHSSNHFIGANAAGVERMIRGASCHVTPRIYADWDSPAADVSSLTIRATATMTAGEATNVVVETQTQWIRLVEHSAAAP